MGNLSLLLMVLVAGVLTAIQPPTNALLVRPLGSPVNAALLSFVVGTLVLLLVAAVLADSPNLKLVRQTPWYAWAGGLYGACFVVVAAVATPRLGVGVLLTLLIAGQLVAAVIVDHLGGFGLPRRPIDLPRLIGVALVIGGVVLVRRG